MIERYTRQAMGHVWSEENKFSKMLEVEIQVAKAQAKLKIIPTVASKDIESKSKFSLKKIKQIEKTTKHDVIAFVTNVADNVGKNGRFVHYGMTSSDVLDTALSLQIKEAYGIFRPTLLKLISVLKKKVKTHKGTLCAGRTHGMHAEVTTLGYKLAGFYFEFLRNLERVDKAMNQAFICKLSGAVGTYSALSPQVEKVVAKALKLKTENVATQVIPRDRHAEIFTSFAILGGAIERLAIEIRHLQRTEVGEVYEGFSKGQKGSSAMPHKKNPIGSENLTGCARLLRSYAFASLENIALWHERDISHSAVERNIFPDAFILADYSIDRLTSIIENLVVNQKNMKRTIEISKGQIYSSHVLLALVDKGLSRERAYEIVQKCSHGLEIDETLNEKLIEDKDCRDYLDKSEISHIFSGKKHIKAIDSALKNAFKQ